ncbi:MAG: hypothetical protein ACT4PM_09915 [Gemmatimonadales bacterium]
MPADRRVRIALALLGSSGFLASSPFSRLPAQTPSRIELDRLSDPAGLERQLRSALRSEGAQVLVPNGRVEQGDFQLAPGATVPGHLLVLNGDAELSGQVQGNVVVLDGDLTLERGAVVSGNALVLGGRIVQREGGRVEGERRALHAALAQSLSNGDGRPSFGVRLAGLAGVLLSLTLLGFALVLFARQRLEVISDTAANSLVRSFLAGLLAEIVALPTTALLIAGLVLSIVGILLIPFVALALVLLCAAAILTGTIAVAHAMGETYVRRRMAAGVPIGSPNSFRYLLTGLATLAAIWLAWVGFGWVPVAGTLILWCSLIATWVVVTAGFGAFLLSRGGTRPAFTGRVIPPEAVTDEYLWATPRFGVDAVKRPTRS